MKCRDPLCEPEKGDEGCMAHCTNVGAFDADDFVWSPAWDGCPVSKAAASAEAEAAAEYEAELSWIDKMMRSDGVL